MRVDDLQGRSYPIEQLSRGTREQLFLAIRLALVEEFTRQGVELPMVLDDVLVNFDAVRAQRAAEVLCDFAAGGHQLLVFTCHEHVWQMFQGVDADCRRLPGRSGKPIDEPTEAPVEPPVGEPKVDDDATVLEPALLYDYPFVEQPLVEKIEEEVDADSEVEVQLPGVEVAYGWKADDVPPLTA
ncbi:MAG: hypothetical protein IH898_15015 [Planctomycetes bacterium]|nr:hypothetical protein [Planctomycetota bacterium]